MNLPNPMIKRRVSHREAFRSNKEVPDLKHETRLAVVATEKYLNVMLTYLAGRKSKEIQDGKFAALNTQLVERLFEGQKGDTPAPKASGIMPAGIARCENLAKYRIRLKQLK